MKPPMLVARDSLHRVVREAWDASIDFALPGEFSTFSLARELFSWPCNIQVHSIFDEVREDADRIARSNQAVDSKIFSWIVLCYSPRANRFGHVFSLIRPLQLLPPARFVLGIA